MKNKSPATGLSMRAAILAHGDGGAIVNVSSTLGLRGAPNRGRRLVGEALTVAGGLLSRRLDVRLAWRWRFTCNSGTIGIKVR